MSFDPAIIARIAESIALLIGGLFILVGAIGLVKLDTPMKRLHAPTKASTLGVGALLLASMIRAFGEGERSLHEVLIMGFLFVTAPVTAHFISKVHIHHGTERDLPPNDLWATHDVPKGDRDLPRER